MVEVPARAAPRNHLADDALLLHASRRVVEVCELEAHHLIEREQLLLSRCDPRLSVGGILLKKHKEREREGRRRGGIGEEEGEERRGGEEGS